MNNKIKRLPDAELEIMLVIWRAESWVSSSYILNQLGDKRKWALATLMTVLSRLVEKGFLSCEKKGGATVISLQFLRQIIKRAKGSLHLKSCLATLCRIW